MKKKNMIGDMSEWSGMLADLFRQINDGSITKKHLQALLEGRNPFAITNIREEWQEFYRKYFRLTVNFSKVLIPDNPGGFERVIFVPEGLTFSQVIKALRKKFKVCFDPKNLDQDITENVWVANKNYAIRLRDRQEADEEFEKLSADQIKRQKINTVTLFERLVYELKYYDETGEHLNINSWTLCAVGLRY